MNLYIKCLFVRFQQWVRYAGNGAVAYICNALKTEASTCSVYNANVLRGGSNRANYSAINLIGHLKTGVNLK